MPFDAINVQATGSSPVAFNLLSTGRYAQVVQVNIGTVGGAETPLIQGQALSAASLPVVLASDHSNINVAGPAASDAPVSGNPLVVAGRASAAAPTDVSADGDVVAAWRLRNGAGAVVLTAAGALIGGDASNGLDVDVTRVPFQLTDNAGFTDGTSILAAVGMIFDDVAGTALTENDIAAPRIDSKRAQVMVIEDGTTRGTRATVTTQGLQVETRGPVTADQPTTSNPVPMAGRASAAAPSDVSADGDAVHAWHLRNGAQATVITAAGALIGGDATNGLDVDVTRLSTEIVDNAGFTDGTTKLVPVAFIYDDVAGTALTENDAAAARIDSKRAQMVVLEDATTRGQKLAISAAGAASVNTTQIGGVSISVGAGAVGTGVQRVTWCSDSPANVVDNAGFTDGTTGLVMQGFIFDETAGTGLTENDAAAARVDSKRAQVMVLEDGTTRGTRQGVTSDGAAKAVSKFLQVDASTLTRPANTTAYTANDAVSNNATAGSVTAQTASFSAIADHPVTIDRVRVRSTDTGVAGKAFRVYLFNSDPTASTGVGGGDNAAWSQKLAGFIGSMSGVFRTFSDGAVALMVPDEGARIIAKPGSGVTTIWLLFQTLEAFTPSANSTTFIATLEGMQGHA